MNKKLPDEVEAVIAAFVAKLAAFQSGADRTCPACGTEVASATIYEKIEPETFTLYVQPCNCRLGLWSKVPEWITEVKAVPSSLRDELDDDEDEFDDAYENDPKLYWDGDDWEEREEPDHAD